MKNCETELLGMLASIRNCGAMHNLICVLIKNKLSVYRTFETWWALILCKRFVKSNSYSNCTYEKWSKVTPACQSKMSQSQATLMFGRVNCPEKYLRVEKYHSYQSPLKFVEKKNEKKTKIGGMKDGDGTGIYKEGVDDNAIIYVKAKSMHEVQVI